MGEAMAFVSSGNAGAVAISIPRVKCGVRRSRKRREGEEAMSVGVGGRELGFGGSGKKPDVTWQCARGCGACCKLDKGPAFPTPEEIFSDDPSNLQFYKSLIGPDGWCINYDHATRTCSIYRDRPFFCRVEPVVFQKLYGIHERRFNKEACSSCMDTISAVYGSGSEELKNFNRTIRTTK